MEETGIAELKPPDSGATAQFGFRTPDELESTLCEKEAFEMRKRLHEMEREISELTEAKRDKPTA